MITETQRFGGRENGSERSQENERVARRKTRRENHDDNDKCLESLRLCLLSEECSCDSSNDEAARETSVYIFLIILLLESLSP